MCEMRTHPGPVQLIMMRRSASLLIDCRHAFTSSTVGGYAFQSRVPRNVCRLSSASLTGMEGANMDVAILPAVAALAGSLIGGLSTLTASLTTQGRQFRGQALIQ